MFNPTTVVPPKFYTPSLQAAASAPSSEMNARPVYAKDRLLLLSPMDPLSG